MLFGAFTASLTKEVKGEMWKEIVDECERFHGFKVGKDWQYVRDTIWPNIRNYTVVSFATFTC